MLKQKAIDWLRLTLIPSIGPIRAKRLLDRFINPESILKASVRDIAPVLGDTLARTIHRERAEIDVQGQLKLIDKYKVKLITQDDSLYPENLKNIEKMVF